MEAKIKILEMSPRLPYLKHEITDIFSISFVYEDNIIKIEDLESYINKQKFINIIMPNNFKNKMNFYLIRNSTNIIGFGELPLANTVKWFNLTEYNNKKMNSNNVNLKIIEDMNINTLNKEKDPSTFSSNNETKFQEIINSNNIKFKISIEIINYNDFNNSKTNMSQKSTSIKGSGDSNSNSISNTCSNPKTPKTLKNINLLPKSNNILLKNNNTCFKKIDIYSKNKSNNSTLFSSINNKLLRNQTEKKLINKYEKKEKIFSFNDYYDINNNKTETEAISPSEASKKKLLNLTNIKKDNKKYNIFNKRKQIINTIEQFSNIDNRNDSSKLLNEINFPKNFISNKKVKNKSSKKIKIKNNNLNKNFFEKQIYKNEKLKLSEENINNNSFKKIEDVIIDQNFKNKIKNDEFLGIMSNNSSIISSSFYSTKNKFYENINKNEEKNFIYDYNKEIDDIVLINFNNKKNEVFNLYNYDNIKKIKKNSLFLEINSFIYKVIEFENHYQKNYKELYNIFINFKNYLELFKFLVLNYTKKKSKLEYIKSSFLLKKEKNNIIYTGFECFKDSNKNVIKNNEIPFWNELLHNNLLANNIIRNNRTKIELIKIFLEVCKKNQKYFNALSKKCYNDIKNKYLTEQSKQLVKSFDKQYNSPSKNKKLTHNTSSSQIHKFSTKNNFYTMSPNPNETNMKTPKGNTIFKKSGNFKKEGLIMEKNKISSFFHNKTNSKKFKKSVENTNLKNKYK